MNDWITSTRFANQVLHECGKEGEATALVSSAIEFLKTLPLNIPKDQESSNKDKAIILLLRAVDLARNGKAIPQELLDQIDYFLGVSPPAKIAE